MPFPFAHEHDRGEDGDEAPVVDNQVTSAHGRLRAGRRVERRTFPRTSVQLNAGVIVLDELDVPPLTCVVENVSGGGIRLRAERG